MAVFLDAYDAILFDMDGTLVATEELWFEAGRAVAARFGAQVPPAAASRLHGLDVPALVQVLTSDFGLQASLEDYSEALHMDVIERLAGAASRPGAGALVEGAAASGRQVALVSNSSHEVIEATLAPFEWAQLLEQRFSVDDVAVGKPAPDLYLHASGSLGVKPARCVVIEDSVAGVTSAVRAGATCIAVSFEMEPQLFEGLTPLVAGTLGEAFDLLLGR